MTMVSCGLTQWPRSLLGEGITNNTGAISTITLNATTDAMAWMGNSPVTDSLTTIYFRTQTVTTGADVDVRIETVVAGRPSGTLWAANTNVVVAVADGDDNVWKTATLTSAASLNMGDQFAIVIASSAGSPNMALATTTNSVSPMGYMGATPTLLANLTGAYAAVTLQPRCFEWIVQFASAGIKYISGLSPVDGAMTLTAFNSGSTPNERALRFIPPFKCRVVGARVSLANGNANADLTMSLWDATGDTDAEALAQAAIDSDTKGAVNDDGYVSAFFDTAVVLTAGATYYLGIRADTANNMTIYECTTAGTGEPATAIKAFPAESTELYLATRTWAAGTAGAWSTTTTTMPVIELLIDQLDDGAGASGGNANILGGSVIQ